MYTSPVGANSHIYITYIAMYNQRKPPRGANMIRWNVYITPELLEKTKGLAKKRGITTSDVIRTAVSKYLAAVQKAEEARNG